MKNTTATTYLILIIASLGFGCRESEEHKHHALTKAGSSKHDGNEKYAIDTKQSVITWKGANLIGSNSHTGSVYISKGELIIENGELKGGKAEVDMNTIEDENHESDNNLINHLKNADFFDVKKFPVTKIAITKVASADGGNENITANLTIKGITHSVTFPARLEVNGAIVKMNGKLIIDRTKWDIRYKSGKFYENLADQTISDSIEFNIKIVAKK